MSTIIKQFDKRSGLTYAYESVSYWDKEKQQGRSKRKYLGRWDEETGQIIPTKGRRNKKKQEEAQETQATQVDTSSLEISRKFYGATYLLESIGKSIGVTEDLKTCFPDTYKQILSLAFYLILEPDSPMHRFEKWGLTHKHPYGKNISSERSTTIFSEITDRQRSEFFQLQGRRRTKEEFLAYDTTSISSYSETLNQVQYGINKENDKLPQLNLALVFGEESNLPFYYRKLPGNITDVVTVENLLEDLNELGFTKVKLVMDRGFYSEKNINHLFKRRTKFLIAAKSSTKFIRQKIDKVRDEINNFEHFLINYDHYGMTSLGEWNYVQERPQKGDVLKEKRRLYLHIYYNKMKATEAEMALDREIYTLRTELESGNRQKENSTKYTKYFDIKTTPKRGTKATVKEDVVKHEKQYTGYFVLVSNQSLKTDVALNIYRNKDVVEKAFGNLKERLSMRRMLVSSEQSLNGKLFVQFIALIFMSHLKKMMQEQELFSKYTMHTALDKLDIIELYENPGNKPRVSEITERQKILFMQLGVEPPQ